ncbi:Uncharacterised protein [Mesomycoplasma conjunctivae]|uniref:Uncharacterized protein n=1 Tax=Mesomycoplasma conjunctivae (strain ATCC 25834 / NCTC 10147 / HRC/581) TaxID=572263 RepID=C5J6N0_MESCH|nr:hypothetical protein [Mesomycoplasma conjunctivae]CAT05135.1 HYPOTHETICAL PROTEIN MCJ_004370 [Mesomycoplasma conjunctivae]VEU66151.1 Uncharacterised protein [Mesomycoplasma conjunctivae]
MLQSNFTKKQKNKLQSLYVDQPNDQSGKTQIDDNKIYMVARKKRI